MEDPQTKLAAKNVYVLFDRRTNLYDFRRFFFFHFGFFFIG